MCTLEDPDGQHQAIQNPARCQIHIFDSIRTLTYSVVKLLLQSEHVDQSSSSGERIGIDVANSGVCQRPILTIWKSSWNTSVFICALGNGLTSQGESPENDRCCHIQEMKMTRHCVIETSTIHLHRRRWCLYTSSDLPQCLQTCIQTGSGTLSIVAISTEEGFVNG